MFLVWLDWSVVLNVKGTSVLPFLADVVFTIDRSKTYQSIIGFGGAFTDSTSMNILSLSEGAQDHLLKSYFSPLGKRKDIHR